MSDDVLKDLSDQFYPYAQQKMGFDKPVQINYLNDPQNAEDPLGKTAYYDPEAMEISLFVDGRHPKDILRSLSHELVHHTQNCRGEFANGFIATEGYAQEDEHLREMEREAYEQGNLVFRDFEDEFKANKKKKSLKLEIKINRGKKLCLS